MRASRLSTVAKPAPAPIQGTQSRQSERDARNKQFQGVVIEATDERTTHIRFVRCLSGTVAMGTQASERRLTESWLSRTSIVVRISLERPDEIEHAWLIERTSKVKGIQKRHFFLLLSVVCSSSALVLVPQLCERRPIRISGERRCARTTRSSRPLSMFAGRCSIVSVSVTSASCPNVVRQ